jgi:hypothetical protein
MASDYLNFRLARSYPLNLLLVILLGSLMILTGWSIAASNTRSSVPIDSTTITMSPSSLSLGTVAPGQSASSRITLRNRTGNSLSLQRIESSCPCVRITPGSVRLEPGQTASLLVLFDPTDEPDFRGMLDIEVTGRGDRKEILFQGSIRISVAGSSTALETPELSGLTTKIPPR